MASRDYVRERLRRHTTLMIWVGAEQVERNSESVVNRQVARPQWRGMDKLPEAS